MSLALGLWFWCLVGAILGAIIGRSKNRAPWEAALLGLLLGLIGVLIVAALPRVAATERRAFNIVWLAALLAGTSYVIALVLLIGPAQTRQEADARVPTVPRPRSAQTSSPPMPVIPDRGATATQNHHPMRESRLGRPATMHKPNSVQATRRPGSTPAQALVQRHQPRPTVAPPGTVTQPVTSEPAAPPPQTAPPAPTTTTSTIDTPPTPPAVAGPAAVVAPSPPTPPTVVAPSPPTTPAVVAPSPPTQPVVVTPSVP